MKLCAWLVGGQKHTNWHKLAIEQPFVCRVCGFCVWYKYMKSRVRWTHANSVIYISYIYLYKAPWFICFGCCGLVSVCFVRSIPEQAHNYPCTGMLCVLGSVMFIVIGKYICISRMRYLLLVCLASDFLSS